MLRSMSWIRSHRRSLVVFILAAVLAAAAVAWRAGGPRVETAPVESGPLVHTLVVSGRVQTPNRVEIGTTYTGRVEHVLVVEGDRVRPGQPLVQLETTELRAALAQAQAAEAAARARLAAVADLSLPQANEGLEQAMAQLRFAEQEHARNRELRDRGFISDARLQESDRALAVARAQAASARAQQRAQAEGGVQAREAAVRVAEATAARELAQSRLAQATIRASLDATVLVRNVEPGDIATAGRRLLVLAAAGDTRLSALVDERNLPWLQVGQTALAASEAFPGDRFETRLYYVSPGVDVARGSVEARFRVPKPPVSLRSDMTVSIDIEVARRESAVTLPVGALREDAAGTFVLVLRDGRARRIPVTVGLRAGTRAEITAGPPPGELVVLARDIAEGARVRPR
jgi:HlyD family secretion protein